MRVARHALLPSPQLLVGRLSESWSPAAGTVSQLHLALVASGSGDALRKMAAPKRAAKAGKAPADTAFDSAVRPIRTSNPEGNPLWELFQAHERGPLIHKW